jgi:CRISPR-associated exonuclease Cas4
MAATPLSSDLDADYLPIAGLNTLLYCERRAALQHIERVWRHNAFTIEGTIWHRRAHQQLERREPRVGEVHGMWLKCDRLRLVGKADVVEFHARGEDPVVRAGDKMSSPLAPREESSATTDNLAQYRNPLAEREGYFAAVPYPIEYKRGRRRRWDNDDVQLCAQALCLEEMLGVAVPAGAIFHIKSKRRREIVFTPELRAKTEEAARRLHELVASGVTPPPVLKPRCRGCSLHDVCIPELLGQVRRVRDYHGGLFSVQEP